MEPAKITKQASHWCFQLLQLWTNQNRHTATTNSLLTYYHILKQSGHQHLCFNGCFPGKERNSIYTVQLNIMHTLKALRHGSHRFTCKLHHACLSFVSVHQMALLQTEAADIQLQLTTHVSTSKEWKAELAWWTDTYSGWFTHISGSPSDTARVQDRESSPAKDRRYTAVPGNQSGETFSLLFWKRTVEDKCDNFYGMDDWMSPNQQWKDVKELKETLN